MGRFRRLCREHRDRIYTGALQDRIRRQEVVQTPCSRSRSGFDRRPSPIRPGACAAGL